ncbi:hypothetical protein TanjilG_12846 [Lupinus angustifolius]|uniref:Rhodanese domain-containing protein n=1 Tax=Lupinus angustifolius TaxID=3871 RepID=A0A1J7GQ33_LUPAN|nr:PREDICTED: rhodanese-like domain-containing protein 7 [Lupinus angustifolius]OIW02532.1 hypothetical protein TanjilG_12846 [Lupinus angustifolius]
MLRIRALPLPPPFLTLTTTMLSPSPSSSSANSDTRIPSFPTPSSRNPINSSSFRNLPLFSNSQVQSQSMALSKCFSNSTNPIPISGVPESESDDGSNSLVVVSFYKFADFHDHARLRKPLKELCQKLRVSGGIILAPEGINGSICGTLESVEKVISFIQSDDRLKGLRLVESPVSPEEEAIHHGHSSSSPLAAGEDAPFRWDHVRVKLKKEIVTLGMPDVSPIEKVGKYVGPKDWNALITDPDTVVIDVRNKYEIRIGKFKGAVDPCTPSFREFPSWVDEHFQLSSTDDERSKDEVDNSVQSAEKVMDSPKQHMPRVAMYCTGGIRCEKASSLLLSKGFKEVFHLEGGILKYLEEVPETESLWEGECFVFDKRVSVEHGLVPGNFKLCYGCKQPVSDADMEAQEYEYGVSCPYCFSQKSEEEKERARARQRQFERWGIIGGPDKGRRPTSKPESVSQKTNQLSHSV